MHNQAPAGYVEHDGDVRVPDDVMVRSADFTVDDQESRDSRIADIQADYLSVFSAGTYNAKELHSALEVAALDLQEGLITSDEFDSFTKIYESQSSYENFTRLIEEAEHHVEIKRLTDSARQSHKSGLISDMQMELIDSMAKARELYVKHMTQPDKFKDDGRYGKQY